MINWLLLPLLLPTIYFSQDQKRRSHTWNHETVLIQSSDSDSVKLMAPLPTPIFDFHWIGRALTTLSPTPSPVKTNLY